jgi:hypothetical protein
MGKLTDALIKTAHEEGTEAEEQYQELLKVGNVIGLGFMDVIMDKEGKWKGVAAGLKSTGKGLKKGKKYVGEKLKAGYKGTKKGLGKGYSYSKGKAVAAGTAVGRGAKKVDVGIQRLGAGVAGGARYVAKGKRTGRKKFMSAGKKRALGYGTIAAGVGGGGAAAYKIKKGEEQENTPTAADLIVRYSEGEE